eukprot:symbB.v1.2.012849.t1/scaffold894.1/size156229/2
MLAGEPSTLPAVDALSDDELPQPSGGTAPVKPPKKAKAKAKPEPKPKTGAKEKAKAKSDKPKTVPKAKEKSQPKVKIAKKPSFKRPAAAVKQADTTQELDAKEQDPPQPAAPAVARKAYLEYRKQTDVYSVRVKDATTGKKPEWIRDELQKKAVDVASQQQAAPGEATHAADVDPGKSAEMVEDQEEEQPFDEDAEIEDVE